MVEQTGSSFRNSIFEKALEASITCNLLRICIIRMIPKSSKNGSIFCQKAIKIQAWKHQNRGLEGSGAGLEASWAILGHPGRFWKRLGPSWKRLGSRLGRLGPKTVANMAPSWLPKRSQYPWKIDLKIDQLFDATWNRHFPCFLRFWESKTEPCWFENTFINLFYLDKPWKPKTIIKPI